MSALGLCHAVAGAPHPHADALTLAVLAVVAVVGWPLVTKGEVRQ